MLIQTATNGLYSSKNGNFPKQLLTIYIAGPDVFLSEAKEVLMRKKLLCKEYGFIGLTPLDCDINTYDSKNKTAFKIYQANISMLESCDILIADISPFRGPSVDPGTAFEIGYAAALGKTIIAYTDHSESQYKDRATGDPMHPVVEDFNLTENLMISMGIEILTNSFAHAVKIAQQMKNRLTA